MDTAFTEVFGGKIGPTNAGNGKQVAELRRALEHNAEEQKLQLEEFRKSMDAATKACMQAKEEVAQMRAENDTLAEGVNDAVSTTVADAMKNSLASTLMVLTLQRKFYLQTMCFHKNTWK